MSDTVKAIILPDDYSPGYVRWLQGTYGGEVVELRRMRFGISEFDNLWIHRRPEEVGPLPDERDRPDFDMWVGKRGPVE